MQRRRNSDEQTLAMLRQFRVARANNVASAVTASTKALWFAKPVGIGAPATSLHHVTSMSRA